MEVKFTKAVVLVYKFLFFIILILNLLLNLNDYITLIYLLTGCLF